MNKHYTKLLLNKSGKLLLAFLLFLSAQSKAQLVYIPDANFRTYISGLDPSAMIGDSMDINNVTIQGTTQILSLPPNIQDLTGVEYFLNLQVLQCVNNSIGILPGLPPSLVELYCGNNPLFNLPNLPSTLQVLSCPINNLSSLPILPNGLRELYCGGNVLGSLPAMPLSLLFLDCQQCNISYILGLPPTLINLNCQNNFISCLPQLPNTLQVLTANGNAISCLPRIPSNGNFTSDIGTTVCSLPGSSSTTNITCSGACDGSVTMGFGMPYSFWWSDGSSAPSVVNLCAAPIWVWVFDPNGCAYTDTFSIIEPSPISVNVSTTDATCGNADGSITVNVTGGVSPYVFSIDNGITTQALNVFNNLISNFYTVSVLDANGCLKYVHAIVSSTGGPVISNIIASPANCFGSSDGSITVNVTGGTSPYQYSIDTALTLSASNAFSNLVAENYYVVVKDAAGCFTTGNSVVTEPSQLLVSVNITNSTCGNADGALTAVANGGTQPYTYLWSNGAILATENNLPAGIYTVTVTDFHNCSVTQTVVVGGIGGPSLSVSSISNVSCNGLNDGCVTVAASGGSPPYQYSINGIAWQASNVFCNLVAGTYTVSVTDFNGCIGTTNASINQPSAISLSTNSNNVTCNGGLDGSINLIVSGGTSFYQFNWSNSTITQNITNLMAATYTCTVTDANNCTAITSATIFEPPPLSFGSINPNIISCLGSTVQLCPSITGGTPAYTYLWSTTAFTPCIPVTSGGAYTIFVTDVNGCSAQLTFTVSFSANWHFASVTTTALPTCGLCDGAAIADVTGTQAAAYTWTPGALSGASVTSLCETTIYTMVATDVNGCTDAVNFSLSCRSVWPGDANNDGQADNTDLLAIGIGYGTTGSARANATINWQAEFGLNWADSLVSGTNYKHIDCNGDGAIADDDTIAIIQNFGLTHPLRPAIIPMVLTDPPLYFDIQIDSASVDTVLQIPLMLGTAAIPADSIYGIAFTVSYDTALVKADSITMDFMNCWMNSAVGHVLGIAINDPINGKLYGAVTRTSHTDTSGFGELGRLGVVTVDNISARMTSLYSDTLVLGISDVTLITHDEQYKTVNIIIDSLVINDNTVGVNENEQPFVMNIYPNPATRFLFIEYDAQLKNPIIILQNMLSEEIKINYRINNERAIIDLGTVANGIYLLSVKTEKEIVTRKINIVKP